MCFVVLALEEVLTNLIRNMWLEITILNLLPFLRGQCVKAHEEEH